MQPITQKMMDEFRAKHLPGLLAGNAGEVDMDKININVDEVLKDALQNNNITKEQLPLLKKQYANQPKELVQLLDEFRKNRINYLMSQGYDALDKQGLLPELKEKFLNGFQELHFLKFGKQHSSFKSNDKSKVDLETEIEKLARFVIDNKDETPEMVASWKANFKDDPARLLEILKEASKSRVVKLMGMGWDDLTKKGLLEELKKKFFEGFKILYKAKFGIEYTGK